MYSNVMMGFFEPDVVVLNFALLLNENTECQGLRVYKSPVESLTMKMVAIIMVSLYMGICDEIGEDATIAIDETPILEIKATI